MTDDPRPGELMAIGDFARASGLTPKALRLYDDLGLLRPTRVDAFTGYRWYAPRQLEAARLVASLRLVGMPLARIQTVIGLPPARAAEELESYWRQVEADTASRRQVVSDLLARLGKETSMPSTTTTLAAAIGVSHRQGGRRSQQDAVLATPEILAVADGFGDRDDLAGAALDAFATGGFPAARAVASSAGPASGTTLTAVRLDGTTARLTHVGDGRVHLVRDGQATVLTRDHTMVAALLEAGELTEDEARSHPHRSLLNRGLGGGAGAEDAAEDGVEVVADEALVDLRSGDRLVLTTDGVHAVLGADPFRTLLMAEATAQQVADALAAAVESAGAPDNHSVVVADLSEAQAR
ncbi:MerR family transcriptional regulator [Nocardioides sp. DS6]|uniref:MerR family transcriptional regulator n=1 Tax=Nocardioides eburneus TaxID=3231482 RepID=A0ABV3SZH1_9ACTN